MIFDTGGRVSYELNLLWSNPDPTSSTFEPDDPIASEITNYRFLYVVLNSSSGEYGVSILVNDDIITKPQSVHMYDGIMVESRSATITADGLEFGNATTTSMTNGTVSANNAAAVPLYIYGSHLKK